MSHKIAPHVNMVSEGKLYKLTCTLTKTRSGVEFFCDGPRPVTAEILKPPEMATFEDAKQGWFAV